MKKLKPKSLSQEIEIPILLFLWRWKVATASAVYLRFEPDFKWAPFTAYSRLLRLKRKGFVDFKFSDNCRFKVWTLTKDGFKAISNNLPLLREEGYLSENIEHDIYVLAAHNGDWTPRHSINGVKTITEQELRRLAVESLPAAIPDVSEHRPDGYWVFGNDNHRKIIALEVELNRKSTEDYSDVGEFYNTKQNVNSVLWIVQSESLANKIVGAASVKLGIFRDIHNFVLLSDFVENGWGATIFKGKYRLNKIREFLNKQRVKQGLNNPETNLKQVSAQDLLDSRVTRHESSTYKNIEKSQIGN